MTYDQINTFLTVVKLGNFSSAAEQLFISQSTCSHRVRTLEQELNIQLLIRKNGFKEVKLTTAGEAFLPVAYRCRTSLAEVKAFTKEEKTQRNFSVSAHDSLNCFVFNSIFPKFIKKRTEAKKDFIFRWESHNSERTMELLASGHLDVAFLRNPVRNKNMVMRPVFREEFLIVTPSDSIYDDQKILVKALDPSNEVFMSFTWGNDFARWHDTIFANRGLVNCYCNAVFALNELLMTPDSWALVPASIAVGMSERCGCRVLSFLDATPPEVTTFEVLPKECGQEALKEVDALVEMLKEDIQNRLYFTFVGGGQIFER